MSSKDMASSRNLVSTIGAQASPTMGGRTKSPEEVRTSFNREQLLEHLLLMMTSSLSFNDGSLSPRDIYFVGGSQKETQNQTNTTI